MKGKPQLEQSMQEEQIRATMLAERKLAEIGDKPCPAREACIEDAIRNAGRILQMASDE